MPIPYVLVYASVLGTYGTNGASPGSANGLTGNVSAKTAGPVTLTGVLQDLVALAVTFDGASKAIIQAELAVDNGSPGSSGQVQLAIFEDGVQIGTSTIQSYDSTGTGATANWQIERVPTVGSHTYHLKALGTGDATSTVQAGHAQLVVLTTRGV
jgi:hypothetical protein